MRHARANGKRLGRPPADVDREAMARMRVAGMSIRAIAKAIGISRSTVHKLLVNGRP